MRTRSRIFRRRSWISILNTLLVSALNRLLGIAILPAFGAISGVLLSPFIASKIYLSDNIAFINRQFRSKPARRALLKTLVVLGFPLALVMTALISSVIFSINGLKHALQTGVSAFTKTHSVENWRHLNNNIKSRTNQHTILRALLRGLFNRILGLIVLPIFALLAAIPCTFYAVALQIKPFVKDIQNRFRTARPARIILSALLVLFSLPILAAVLIPITIILITNALWIGLTGGLTDIK